MCVDVRGAYDDDVFWLPFYGWVYRSLLNLIGWVEVCFHVGRAMRNPAFFFAFVNKIQDPKLPNLLIKTHGVIRSMQYLFCNEYSKIGSW